MKISELTPKYIADYLRLDEPDEIELKEIDAMLTSAKGYVKGFTGLTLDEMEEFEDITMAILILVSDYFENRTLYLDYKNKEENVAVNRILSMHSIDLLGRD